jgi:hypothetical protein
MFVILLVGVKLNHAVMEQDFQQVGVIMLKICLCIFVSEEHWAANQNHA